MVVELKTNLVDGHLLKWMMAAGVAWLEHHKQQINNMNVFPVPDGDTGTNMVLTIRKAYQLIADMDEAHVGIVSEQIARGALTGARGNSGTILSMLLRGFAQELRGKDVMDKTAFIEALQNSVECAYNTVRSVMEPVEGTILTVARESVEAVKERARDESSMRVLLRDLVAAARHSLDNTPNLLPKLKEAGVEASGGMGLVYILEGMYRLIEGQHVAYGAEVVEELPADGMSWEDALVPDEEEGYGYDVQFLMLGENMDVNQVRQEISAMGWSPLIDGDDRLIKVHIHVYDPGEPISYAIRLGVELDDIVVENMQAQYLQYVQARQERETHEETAHRVAVVTVARGDGLEKLLREYGAARVIIGGQTMNPSTEDFLSAIDSLDADEIILLPNNGNVLMAAQQAASLAMNKSVKVVPSKTIQQGISALLTYMDLREGGSLDDIVEGMTEARSYIKSAEVTVATRNAVINDIPVKEGQFIGLLDGKLVHAGGTDLEIVQHLLQTAQADQHELATLYYGNGHKEADAALLIEALAEEYPELDFEIVYGGQPLYPYLISIE